MIHRKQLTEEQIHAAMSDGEFPKEVRHSGPDVAVVLTQDWCPEWKIMKMWLRSLEKRNRPEDIDIEIYELEYNRLDSRDEFVEFKEDVLGNSFVPYVRYYRNGNLIDESNYVKRDSFLSRFRS